MDPRAHEPARRSACRGGTHRSSGAKVLDLLASGKAVTEVAEGLGVSGQTIYNWRNQDLIDRGLRLGITSTEQTELAKARRRVAELAATKRAHELLEENVPPGGRFEAAAQMAVEGHPIQVARRVLAVSEAGFYERRKRAPSAHAIRHAWLTDVITQVHLDSRGTYGALRVHAKLTMGRGVTVGHNAVAMLTRRAGLLGHPGARRPRFRHQHHGDGSREAGLHPERAEPALGDRSPSIPLAGARSTAPSCWTCSLAAWWDG